MVLRDAFILDLSSPEGLRFADPVLGRQFRSDLTRALQDEGFNYDVKGPNGSSRSTSSGRKKHIEISYDKKDGFTYVKELAVRMDAGAPRITIRPPVGDGFLEIFIRDDARKSMVALLWPDRKRLYLLEAAPDHHFTKTWPSAEEAFRSDPLRMGRILATLRTLPVSMPFTPADPEIIDLALGWHQPLPKEHKRTMDGLTRRLQNDDVAIRDEASGELRKFVVDALRVRYLLSLLHAETDREVKSRLRHIALEKNSLADAIRNVKAATLYRDLDYLGALLPSPRADVASKALDRIKALTAREFKNPGEFETWYSKRKDTLRWDTKSGTYRGDR